MITTELPTWWQVRRSVIIGISIAYITVLVLLIVFTSKLIFLPPAKFPGTTPAALRLPFEDLHIPVTADSYAHAWYIPAAQKTSTVLIYFHGNAEVLEDQVDLVIPLLRGTGANLLLVDFRGYGSSSPARPTGATAADDARAAMRFLANRGISTSDVIIAGRSIGSAIAAQLAAETPHAGGLILISPISSVADVANRDWLFRYLLRPAQLFLGANSLNTAARIPTIHAPLLILAGSKDELAEPWMAHKIYDRANQPKTLQFIEGADHNDIMEPRDGTLERTLASFIARTQTKIESRPSGM